MQQLTLQSQKCTQFCKIRGYGGVVWPPTDDFKTRTDPMKSYIIGYGIYRRVRINLDIRKRSIFAKWSRFKQFLEVQKSLKKIDILYII